MTIYHVVKMERSQVVHDSCRESMVSCCELEVEFGGYVVSIGFHIQTES